ncbi:MAG: pyruvate dehydrogenase (acetyl-transferring), homodimeric type [Alphaproteobacteria bacterium]|nr:pyruvate dehydrogenase (acetyl-transferring), homodimeric type [Alphaproteobacteria bacterium]
MPDSQTDMDLDPGETQEWLAALESVRTHAGRDRAAFLLNRLADRSWESGIHLPSTDVTPYLNTIRSEEEERLPGEPGIEWRIRTIIRWNAMAMVVRANRQSAGIGGHIASFASSATLYDVGFNHFWHSPTADHGGDLIYIQGHSAPGIYARAFMEGRLSERQLDRFRHEVDGGGLSSYPHPWLMPDFWNFPTVSMGLGPIMAIYQARYMRYLHHRGLLNTSGRKVWAFLGDGEVDEPEALGALSIAARERLDNLIFVVNCNLQRLDGPVRGNHKIIQELERVFHGAGWNVIKVIWGSNWDPLLGRDTSGVLRRRMEECVDGEYQAFHAKGGAYTRENFFGTYPELREMVANLTDREIWRLKRGGHDAQKVYAAYAAAVKHEGQPTVILAKTVKGYGLGDTGEAQNITHQQKKLDREALLAFRDRFSIPVPDDQVGEAPYYRPPDNSPEIRYMLEKRRDLGGFLPCRRRTAESLAVPALEAFAAQIKGSGEREYSTTMAFVRILTELCRDPSLGRRITPIVADEARTFGMEGLFRQLGIYSSVGQLYKPEDADQLMFYHEKINGQILEEGISEAGSISSWIAAGTAYSTQGFPMIPFFIFYSMFGFQRIGDLAWAAADSRTRGFLIGATSGRTTLAGEGLQHQDGHSQLLASLIPNCVSYDPAYACELAVIIQDGLRRMVRDGEDIYYYITVTNETYRHPPLPEGAADGILKGMYRLRKGRDGAVAKVRLLGSGSLLNEAMAAADLLEGDFDVAADVWSVTSFTQLRRDGLDADRWNLLHPEAETRRTCHVARSLGGDTSPVVAATDYVRTYADHIRPWVPSRYVTLGTDGFGRSDTRAKLRAFFEVDHGHITVAALKALSDDGVLPASTVSKAIRQYGIDQEKSSPWLV